jgi:hypothetical protein
VEKESWLLDSIVSISSGSGWWVQISSEMEPGHTFFDPVAVFILAKVKNAGDHQSWEIVIPATASFLQSSSWEVATRNGRFSVSKKQLEEPLYHESQFEEVGVKLKVGESGGL